LIDGLVQLGQFFDKNRITVGTGLQDLIVLKSKQTQDKINLLLISELAELIFGERAKVIFEVLFILEQ
jgi:hypothetical protein